MQSLPELHTRLQPPYFLQFVFRNSSESRIQGQMFTGSQLIKKSVKLRTEAHALVHLLHLGHNTVFRKSEQSISLCSFKTNNQSCLVNFNYHDVYLSLFKVCVRPLTLALTETIHLACLKSFYPRPPCALCCSTEIYSVNTSIYILFTLYINFI